MSNTRQIEMRKGSDQKKKKQEGKIAKKLKQKKKT